MGKKIIICLTTILIVMISALGYKVYTKSKIKEANTVFNESNEVYINRNDETGVIEYKSGTLNINITPIKKSNPNLEMW